jgi:dCMP deaminase
MEARPSWDYIWMTFAQMLAERSTCDRLAVGCVVVSFDNSIVLGLGYNGGPKGLNNECLSAIPGQCGHLHAEINALIKTNYRDASPKKVYLTTSPCYGCSVALVNAGVQEVIFKELYRDQSGLALLAKAGIGLRQFPEEGFPERYLSVDEDGLA